MHLVVFEVPFEHRLIRPPVDSLSIEHVVLELAFIGSSIGPDELSIAMFFIVEVLTFIDSHIGPELLPDAIFHVVFELPLEEDLVGLLEDSVSVEHVVLEMAFVVVSLGIDESSESLHFIGCEFSFVVVLVLENQFSEPLSLVVLAEIALKDFPVVVLEDIFVLHTLELRGQIVILQLVELLLNFGSNEGLEGDAHLLDLGEVGGRDLVFGKSERVVVLDVSLMENIAFLYVFFEDQLVQGFLFETFISHLTNY